MAGDFQRIIDHPEKQGIISRLVTGEQPKAIASYLRSKYKKDDEKHLRLPVTLLQEFINAYGTQYGFAKAVVKKDKKSKLEKQIADSLLNNKEWRERIAEITDDEIDLKRKLKEIITILEARAEQLFDHIQSNPENTKADYIFVKYLELLTGVIEKADKIINDKPDITIQHNYTVQMVEQQSVAFQEAIRKVLMRMEPEHAAFFMDALNEEMAQLSPVIDDKPKNTDKQFEKNTKDVDKLLISGNELGAEFEEINA